MDYSNRFRSDLEKIHINHGVSRNARKISGQ
jgi:hypothetical protein